MSTATESTQQVHQRRWQEVVRDPSLRDLPYKVETNQRGQLILSPHTTRHARQQKSVITLLDDQLSGGESYPEYPLATDQGVKQPDVVWISRERQQEMDATGDPPTLAPEICVEVMSESNTDAEMAEKRRLYRSIGAEEVWIVSEDGQIRFFTDEEIDQSGIAPECPSHLPTE
jgi:Uma2 family endonuclease